MNTPNTPDTAHTSSSTDINGIVARLLAPLRRRQRALNTLTWGGHGLLIGAATGCIVAMILWLLGESGAWRLIGVGTLVIIVIASLGALAGALRPTNDLALARSLDRAGNGQDRFASALQLIGDPHRARTALIVEDAAGRLKDTPAAAALPWRTPNSVRWAAAPISVLLALALLLPQSRLQGAPIAPPEISPEQWKELADEFHKELAQLPKPLTAEEEDLQKELERLAEKLNENPDKKDALKEIARLSDRVENERRSISAKEMSLRKAAKAMSKSAALKNFAAKMQQGAYQDAAEELKAVAARMQNGELSPDAEEFEGLSADLENLAKEAESDQDLAQDVRDASSAASKMNKKELAAALKRLSEQLKKNAGKYQKSDSLAKHKSMLDELKRRMNKGKCRNPGDCDGDEEGDGLCDKPGGGRGGKKAGWGSMAKWDGGRLNHDDEKRAGEMSDAQENHGSTSSFQIVSPDEKAKSGKRYQEMYAGFVRKSEADLDLDSVPVSQREYLRRYFKAIRPQEPAADAAAPASGTEPPKP